MRISRRKFRPKKILPVYYVNETVRFPQVRLIDENGEHIGVIDTPAALARAREKELDLVVVQAKAEPPLAKITEFGKWRYEQDKEQQKAKARQKSVEVKGIRLSARIGEHDMRVRLEQAKKFLGDGDKIKIEIIMRGREKAHAGIAAENITDFIKALNAEIPVKVEQSITRQGGQLTSIVAKA